MKIKLQRNWKDIKKDLHKALEGYSGSPTELANGAKIDYFSARRYLMNPPENQTESAIKLCTYFSIDIFIQNEDLQLIMEAVLDSWDGSKEHAIGLAELLKWSKSFHKGSHQN